MKSPKTSLQIKIKTMRKLRGLTQEALAEKSDLSLPSIKDWEGGRRKPSFNSLRSLALGLGTPIEYFYDDAPIDLSEPSTPDLGQVSTDDLLREIRKRLK